MHPRSLTFPSGGERVHAWHFTPGSDVLDSADGAPVVVMAHGLGGTKDSGLAPFAARLAAAGMHVLAFDYRGFGESGGTDRQRVDVAGQIADYRAPSPLRVDWTGPIPVAPCCGACRCRAATSCPSRPRTGTSRPSCP